MKSISSTLSEDTTNARDESSDSENSGPSWWQQGPEIDWGKDENDDMLFSSSPPRPSVSFPTASVSADKESFPEQYSSTSGDTGNSMTTEKEPMNVAESSLDEPKMYAIDPDPGSDGPSWYNKPQQDWGMEEHGSSPIILPPERPKDKPKTWDPHAAVDEPVDLMTKYSSSNGEWWSHGKSDTSSTNPTQAQRESTVGESRQEPVDAEESLQVAEKKDQEKSPHTAVDQPVDLMATYSSNNGEWWSQGKKDTSHTSPTHSQRERAAVESPPGPKDTEESLKVSQKEHQENPSYKKKVQQETNTDTGVDLVTVSPNNFVDSKFENEQSTTPPAATNTEQTPTTTESSSSSNLTPTNPNNPLDTKLDQDDTIPPILTSQDASDNSWYNSPIDSSFFNADRD